MYKTTQKDKMVAGNKSSKRISLGLFGFCSVLMCLFSAICAGFIWNNPNGSMVAVGVLIPTIIIWGKRAQNKAKAKRELESENLK
jgi:hypothetical protein